MCPGPASFTSELEEVWGPSCKTHLRLGKPHVLYVETAK